MKPNFDVGTRHALNLWPNIALNFFFLEPLMGNKIVTEADRKYTPPLKALPGVTLPTTGRGQRVSSSQYLGTFG